MRVTFLGTGSAMPSSDRVQTGILLEREGQPPSDEPDESDPSDERRGNAAGTTLLVDCGSGVLHRLSQTDVGYENVSTVLLTHHHLDHVADLLPLLKARWLAGEEFLKVVGPTGTKALIDGLLDAHDYLRGKVDLQIREVGTEPFEVAGFAVEGYEVRHSMHCLAYRFEASTGAEADGDGSSGGTFTFSGDTEAFDGLANFADGSDVLAHDCSFPDEVDVSNHPTPTQLGDALAGTDVGRVYLTHLYPHTEGNHREMLDAVESRFDGDVRFARDGLRFEI